MTTAATSLLGLALPVTGELSGTWGDTVNNSITSLLDSAVAGTTTISTDGDVTLTTTTLAANQAREAILLFSGARTALRTVTAPAQSKIYTVINATTGGFAVKLVGVGPTTGLTIPAGASAVVAWNGSDFVEIGSTTLNSLTVSGNLSVAGTTTLTGAATLTANPVFNGGTANGVAYLNGSKVVTTGTALQFDGSNLGVGVTPSSWQSTRRVLQVGTNAALWGQASGSGATFLSNNTYFDGTSFKYLTTSAASYYLQVADGSHTWNTAPSGTAGAAITFTQAMTLDASGNLGIGTSSPATKLDVASSAASSIEGTFRNSAGRLVLTQQASGGAITQYYKDAAVTYVGSVGTAVPGGSAQSALIFSDYQGSWQERMRLDSAGNLGLGVTPSAWRSTVKAFQTGGGSLYNFNGVVLGSAQNAYLDSVGWKYSTTAAASSYEQSSGTHAWSTAPSGTAGNAISFTQAMTLDSSGNLLVAQTSLSITTLGASIQSNGYISSAVASSTNGNSNYNLYSTGAGAYRFYVGMGGTVYATSTTITGISDQRLKENIRDLDEGLDVVLALKPRKFDWKEGKGQNIKNARGFIAQEFETVLPDMIEEWKDPAPEGEEPYKAVNANLIPTLVKAIQEQQALITTLIDRITALESK